MRIRNYVILLSVLVSSLRVHCAKLLPISIMFIFWILFLHSFLTFLTTLSPRLYFTFTIMVPFAVFALGIFCFRFLFCLWPFSHSQFLLMEKWQLNMDKHLSYALELERAAAWGRNLMSVILWGLCAKFGIRNSSRSSSREISVNQHRRDYFLFRVAFLSYCSSTVQENDPDNRRQTYAHNSDHFVKSAA